MRTYACGKCGGVVTEYDSNCSYCGTDVMYEHQTKSHSGASQLVAEQWVDRKQRHDYTKAATKRKKVEEKTYAQRCQETFEQVSKEWGNS